jgi:hypothetical protein
MTILMMFVALKRHRAEKFNFFFKAPIDKIEVAMSGNRKLVADW